MSVRKISGEQHLKSAGSLLIPNRLNLSELKSLEKLLGFDRIIFLVEQSSSIPADIQNFLKNSRATGYNFDIHSSSPSVIGDKLRAAASASKFIILIPGNVQAHPAELHQIPSAVSDFLFQTALPVQPVYFSRELNTTLTRLYPSPSQLHIGHPVNDTAELIQGWMFAEEEWFSQHPALQRSLAEAIVQGIKAFPHGRIIDGSDDSSLPYLKLLAAAIVLAKSLNSITSNSRIGIILPPGKACTLANMACILAGKIPVNINFSVTSQESLDNICETAKIERFITADAFVRKLPGFPWPAQRDLIFIERLLPDLRSKIGITYFTLKLLPPKRILQFYKIPQNRDTDECELLFTSGSSAAPKGVPLTHRNVLANIIQCASRLALPEGSRILGCLPVFHSFGSTVTVWFPLIEGLDVVTYVSPLESKRIGELVRNYSVNFVMMTPTFLRGIWRRCEAADFQSVHMLITGAEKLPQPFATAFEKKFGIAPREGYGLTETSPVCSFNLKNLPESSPLPVIPSSRTSSVGKIIPGIALRITCPINGNLLPPNQSGMIWLKGPNIFSGYLKNPDANNQAFDERWFKTGDIGRIDNEGFLYIEGRMSRFSKVGGEMISHETVEALIHKVLDINPADNERKIAVVGVPDEKKGEVLALLSTLASPVPDHDLLVLKYKLIDEKLTNLSIPQYIIPVSTIPLLPTGKLDLKACAETALLYVSHKRR